MEDEVLVAEDGSIIEQKAPPKEDPPAEEATTAEDESLSAGSEAQHEDEQATEGETEEDAEARRERNRQRRAENKQRRRDHIESLKREIAARDEILQQQASRLDALERRSQSTDMAMVEAELKKAADAYNFFKSQHAEAVSTQNGELAAETQEKMYAAMQRAQQLDNIRRAAVRPQAQQPQPLDPRLKMQAEQWLERNSWYDPDGRDTDSQIVGTLDRQLHAEGWDPTVPQYWEELDARAKKYLPHRYGMNYNSRQGNRGKSPVAGSGREGTNQASGGYRLSAERVQALKDAGMWDDPKQRADMIKRYQQIDKEQANG